MIEERARQEKPTENCQSLVPVETAAKFNWRKLMKFLISAFLVLAILGTLAVLVKFMIGAIGAVLGILLLGGLLSIFSNGSRT